MEHELLKKGNHKLSSKIGIWTLPRSTCIGAGICAKYCYAKKFENCPSVKASRDWKLSQTKDPQFVTNMIRAITKRKFTIIRIHESGEFYSQAYLNQWMQIANALPDVKFFVYTKAFSQLDFSGLPSNIVMWQSYGSNHDSKADLNGNIARVISHKEELQVGEYLCPYWDKNIKNFKCGETCSHCMESQAKGRVAFLMH